ncbi:MAG TPA: signal peptidase I [Vicinamibacteria bacterium]
MSSSTGASEELEPEIAGDAPAAAAEAPVVPESAAPSAAPAVAAPSAAKSGRFQSLVDLLHDLAIAVVVCVLLITYVVQAFKVQGTSMSPELQDGERILVNKFLYYFGDIQRGDVVVFWYPEDPQLSFIKRVVALPGETVEIRSGRVFVNDMPVDEPYVSGANADERSFPRLEIRPGHFFVLGDNRKGSNDSRSWGLVPQRYIYGKAFLRIWPPREAGVVD